MSSNSELINAIEQVHPVIEPVLLSVIQSLHLPLGSRGLDAGSGIGLISLMLADAIGPTGHVTGVDQSQEYIHYAGNVAQKKGYSEQISFQAGDVQELPFEDRSFDWAWSSDCIGYSPEIDPYRAVQELARVVRPGGSVMLLAWSTEKLLPGYPFLENRLNATRSGMAPFTRNHPPEHHFSRALTWMRQAGLKQRSGETFAGSIQAPLKTESRKAVEALFAMRWAEVESELSSEEYALYERLCLPGSPEFIADQPDYYGFFTLTLFTGFARDVSA
jgi:demethylmenaquinone methyltransferase/2-methoxy-6-polyprenyl-1,4-benzoquinol methylase